MKTIILIILLISIFYECGSESTLLYLSEIDCKSFKSKIALNATYNESNYHYDSYAIQGRKTDYPIHPLIQSRISAKQMTGEEMTDDELFPLFEAARWAPSSYNLQEWRFVYAKRNTSHWNKFFDLLIPYNQNWSYNASVLVVMLSAKYEIYKGNKTIIESHSFDCGSAWMSLALEGSGRGYAVRAIEGFDHLKAQEVINLTNSSDYKIEVMIAIGKRSPIETEITQRNSVKQFVSEGVFVEKVVLG